MLLQTLHSVGLRPELVSQLNGAAVPAHEQHLSDQLDSLRDSAKNTEPSANLRLFQSFLDSLPRNASSVIRFRAKANIGLQHLAGGDAEEAVRWLLEAYDEAPDDRRAVANRTLALSLRGDAEEAYKFGRERLAADPENELLASYLPQIAVNVPSIKDGLEGIPDALREKEPVVVAQGIFLRGRNLIPAWWEWVRSALDRFPESDHLKLLVASSYVDEIARDEEAQRTQIYRTDQRERLTEAVAILDADWQARPWLLKSRLDDALSTLANAMIAYRLLHDRDNALARAERIADEALTYPDIILNAVMIAMSFDQMKLASRLIALVPDDPDLAFHAGIIALGNNDWRNAGALLEKANVPDAEKRVAETVIALAPIVEKGRPTDGSPTDPAPLEALAETFRDSPRGLILIAQVATDQGLDELAQTTLEAAVAAVPDDCHIATRLMIANYAEKANSPTTVIQLLDGHLPLDGFELEHQRLAVAHANERPHRQRNLKFFENLPARLRNLRGIARAHASVLLDVGRLPEAIHLLRHLQAENPTDAFITLRLLQAFHHAQETESISALLGSLDLSRSVGPPEYIMAIAQEVSRGGYPERAYPVAYDLVRRHADDASVVLGYAGLGLMLEANPMFAMSTVGVGAYVSIQASDGQQQNFVIDDGGDFFGIRVLSPTSGIAIRVLGRSQGDTIEIAKFGQDHPEVWTVTEVVNKYLHLHLRVLEEFETRFPDNPGIARYTVGEDIDTVLDVVRRGAERNAEMVRRYMEKPVPLGIAARGQGGDVVGFAQYVRQLGGLIITCVGNGPERDRAHLLVNCYRGKGAVLDPYTAWVAAEIEVLPSLKSFFGSLRTPGSTFGMIDRMIHHAEEGRGREQMTLSYRDGQFYKNEITDEFRDAQIAALKRIRDAIEVNCEVVPVVVPDDLSEPAEMLLTVGGSHFLDAALLAVETNSILLSDDLRYLDFSSLAVKCDGIWLQIALSAACGAKHLTPSDYAKSVVCLAERGHDHIALTGGLLYLIARQDQEGFPGLQVALRFLAGPKAEMPSHLSVFHDFLNLLWPPKQNFPKHRAQTVTGLGLTALLAHRTSDWAPTLIEVISWSERNRGLARYLAEWLRGHFITEKDLLVGSASSDVQKIAKRRRKRR